MPLFPRPVRHRLFQGREARPAVQEAERDRSRGQPAPPETLINVLVAEDNRVNQIVIECMLQRAGCSVTVCTNGLDVLDVYCGAGEDALFDMILMDVQMPEMDGLAATAAIRSVEKVRDRRRVPIIGLTGGGSGADRQACFAAGMDDYLEKPLKPDVLAEKMLTWLGWSGRIHKDGPA